jgi:hypothetical protein
MTAIPQEERFMMWLTIVVIGAVAAGFVTVRQRRKSASRATGH